MIVFPKSTLVGKPVPKTAFYRNLEVNAKIKQRFVDDVASVTWTAKIAPSTLNVADGKTVHEIAVFRMELKSKEVPTEVLTFIDRQMPRHTVFLLQHEDDFCLMLNYKEWADEDKGVFSIVKTFRTGWQTADALSLSLEGSTMDKLYEHMAGQISGFDTTSAADTKQIIALQDTIRTKQRQAEALQKKVRMEKRFAKQMQLNAEARTLKLEVARLNEQLNELTKEQQ